MLTKTRSKLEELKKVSDELGDAIDDIEDNMFKDLDQEHFSQINPKDYIYWLFNTDSTNKDELIEELNYWNKDR